DPCWSGRAFVREQRSISLLRFGAGETGEVAGELPGYRFDDVTIKEVAELRLPVEDLAAAGRALVLTRPDAAVPAGARDARSGATVEWREAVGQAELIDVEPVFSRVPTATMADVVTWLGGALGGDRHWLTGPTRSAGTTVLAEGDQHIVERCRRLGPLGLFGIETAPFGDDAKGPVIVMSNSGIDSHVGPNRLWVDLARQLAARGLRSIRFDLSGLGDSPARPGQRTRLSYAPESLADIGDVAAAASPEDPGNVVLVGLCSSAYLSLEGALQLLPRGVAAINPIFRFSPPEMAEGPMDRRRRICRPLTSAVRVFRAIPFAALRDRLHSLAWRMANRAAGSRAPDNWMHELTAAGVDVFCIGGENELQPLLEVDREATRCRIDVMPGLDHALLYSPDRDQVATALLEHLADKFAPAPRVATSSLMGGGQ
ncbi:MAG: alpha/beta hydrolase, partial [Acidimicrobiales bacterium]